MDILREIEELQLRLCELQQRLPERDEGPLALSHGVLVGEMGSELVALPLSLVDEIVPAARLAPLPGSPSWVAGLLDLRGEMLPVVDGLARASSIERDLELTDQIVVCIVSGRRVGLILQRVTDVCQLRGEELKPPPAEVPFAPYVVGVLKGEAQPTLLLSVSVLTAGHDLAGERGA